MMVELPIKAESTLNLREHWATRHRRTKMQRQTAHRELLICSRVRPELPCIVTLTRIAPRKLDGDNLQGSLKAVRDGVADYFGVADNSPLIDWRYAQERRQPNDYAVKVEISEHRINPAAPEWEGRN